ncbi:hypothetical protein [Candidatus Halobonum tyrrellensis]|uniref:DUF8052 domain-containing protein n=1 Tax=Candidatus Halobonum tyrrellensis G22 TaxID=1324957 RepID=V4J2G7_9EURY|nr:hypothetical protein [Candidatus Halobonum tyrrellensis]ESP89602.1 hypothetical protein K933_03560 [Candidatus Halobonum tyrrellensis G22]
MADDATETAGDPERPDPVGGRDRPERPADVPTWDDEFLDRASDRLLFNYDLARDETVGGERFDLTGEMRVDSRKQFLHESLTYANHHADEYLFARRVDGVTVADLERLVELGHELADERITPDEEHYGTDLSFVLVAPTIPEAVREFVLGFRERQLLAFGYYGHYEVNLGVVAPDDEEAVASREADVVAAFTPWDDVPDRRSDGFLARVRRALGR